MGKGGYKTGKWGQIRVKYIVWKIHWILLSFSNQWILLNYKSLVNVTELFNLGDWVSSVFIIFLPSCWYEWGIHYMKH